MIYLKKSTHKVYFTFLVDFLILLVFSIIGFIFIQAETQTKDNLYYKHYINQTHFKDVNYIKSNVFDTANYSTAYQLLAEKLIQYNDLQKNKNWENNIKITNEFKFGDTSTTLLSVRNKLFLLNDLKENNLLHRYDSSLYYGVKNFQLRYGLKPNGILTKQTVAELNRPLASLINTIQVNLTRRKLEQIHQEGDYVIVNLPAFYLHTYYNSEEINGYKVIIGKTTKKTQTKIFNDTIEYIVFCPYWNIPKGIITNEILPEIKKNQHFLKQNNMEVTNQQGHIIPSTNINWFKYTKKFPYLIRQKPGEKNALGKVKFLFPNRYTIYVHDTPEKKLFSKQNRAYSHGCIRIESPLNFAYYLLRKDKNYTKKKINSILQKGKETHIKLKNNVPIYITYYTAWVDAKGTLNFREDIYKKD